MPASRGASLISRPRPKRAAEVFVTRRIPEAGLDLLRRAGVRVTVGEHDDARELERGRLLEGLHRADALLCLLTDRLDREALEASGNLSGVAQMAVGFDNVDLPAATELGLPVSNTPGILTETTADFAWALLLAVARRVPEAHAYTLEGRFGTWGPTLLLGGDVGPGPDGRPKVLGILGYGRIGEAVARRATGFGMEILAHSRSRVRIDADPKVRFAELDELFARSDFLTLHPPLSPGTRHLVGERELRRMRPTAYLINTSRGPVVDEGALVRALGEGWIAGAGLDVFEREPELAEGLAELPNVVLAPHIASASHDTRGAMATRAAVNVLAHLRGERAPNVLDAEVYGTEAWKERCARAADRFTPPRSSADTGAGGG